MSRYLTNNSVNWPYPTGVVLNTVHQKLVYQGALIFSTNVFSIIIPTKTASTSMRKYFEDFKIENIESKVWDHAKERIVMLRHPMERYYSGLIEMTRHATSGGGQNFDQSWKSHIHPVCTSIEEFKGDYKIILMKNLGQYVPKHYNENNSIQKDMDPEVEAFFTKIKMGKDPLVALHRERDMWWLREEIRAYSEIVRTKEILDPQEFKRMLKRSLKS